MFSQKLAKVENYSKSTGRTNFRPQQIPRAHALTVVIVLVASSLLPITASAGASPSNQTSVPPVVYQASHKIEPVTVIDFAAKAFLTPRASRARLVARQQAIKREAHLREVRLRRLLASPIFQNYILLLSLTGPSPWDGLARCETGANWHVQGPIRGGGLGYTNSVWKSFVHGLDPNTGKRIGNDLVQDFGYPELPGWASREQQIVVGERERIWNGGTTMGAWGCGSYYGK